MEGLDDIEENDEDGFEDLSSECSKISKKSYLKSSLNSALDKKYQKKIGPSRLIADQQPVILQSSPKRIKIPGNDGGRETALFECSRLTFTFETGSGTTCLPLIKIQVSSEIFVSLRVIEVNEDSF